MRIKDASLLRFYLHSIVGLTHTEIDSQIIEYSHLTEEYLYTQIESHYKPMEKKKCA